MPVDSRRLQGPESAFSYTLLEKKGASEGEPSLSADFQKILISANEVRKDKRKPTDARPLCKLIFFWILILLSAKTFSLPKFWRLES